MAHFKETTIENQSHAQARQDAVTIGEHFSAWRRLRGLKLTEVALQSGVAVNTVRDLESGKGGTGLVPVLAISRVLGIDGLRPEALDPYAMEIGRARTSEKLPQRVH